MFILSNGLTCMTIVACCVFVKEEPLRKDASVQHRLAPAGFFADICSIFRMFNRVCWIVWIVLALMNFTWGLATIFIPTFMGMSILHGDPAAPPESKAALAYD